MLITFQHTLNKVARNVYQRDEDVASQEKPRLIKEEDEKKDEIKDEEKEEDKDEYILEK